MTEHIVSYYRPMCGRKLEVYHKPWCWWLQPQHVQDEFRAWWRKNIHASRQETEAFLLQLRLKHEGRKR